MSTTSVPELTDWTDPSPSQINRESNGPSEMDDQKKTMARVAQFIEQLHTNKSSPSEKELITARLLGIAKARKEARVIIGSHGQAMPLFISILRTGTLLAKLNVASTLTVLCRDEDLRLKVLLGGCVPPLISMLKSPPIEARKAAAEAIYAVSSGGLSHDHVGMKIFATEGVVPMLWEQLNLKFKQDKVVQGFITGTLRNLCGDKDGYWSATSEAGGVDIIVGLLSSDNPTIQSNAASLLARLISNFEDSIPKVVESNAINVLLKLLHEQNDISVCANAADALEVLCSRSTKARRSVADAHGVPVLIDAVNAPSREGNQGQGGQELQQHATKALAYILGGMPLLILYLGELSQSPRLAAPVADILGALAYSLMVFEQNDEEEMFDATKIESILITLLKPRDNQLVQERVLEAMASLYGNEYLSRTTNESEAKKIIVGLVTLASGDAQEYLILSLIRLCSDGVNFWEAIGKREGIQLLMTFLGLASEHHQEYAVELLAILTDRIDESKWAITAAGGIPPLVQLLEMGSQKAREDGAHVLWNLCCHSEDIRACIESAEAIPALLSLLKNGREEGQEISGKTLILLIHSSDEPIINHLLVLLLGDSPRSKTHVIKVLGHVLSFASQSDMTQNGAAANKGLRSLVQVLNSSNEKTQEHAASILADLFSNRHDISHTLATDEVINPCIKLLTSNTQGIATESAGAFSALSHSIKIQAVKHKSYIAEGDVKPLTKLAKVSSITSAETAVAALANLMSDPHIAAEALADDIVPSLIRVLAEGSMDGKKNASRTLSQLLRHFPVDEVLVSSAQCRFAVLAILDAINAMDMDGNDASDALDVIAALARSKGDVNFSCTFWSTLVEVPASLGALVSCLSEGSPPLQEKAIKILSRLCGDQPSLLGDALITNSTSIDTLANRVMNSSTLEVRVGGAAMLICAAKEHRIQVMDVLDASGSLNPLIYSLVDMMKQNSSCSSLEIEVMTPRAYGERPVSGEGNEFEIPDPASVLGGTVALWLLSIISSFHAQQKVTVLEGAGLDVLLEKLVNHTSNPLLDFEDTEGIWITSLLVAILFQDASVVLSPASMEFINPLALLLKSDEVIDRFFAAQAMASLVSHGNRQISLAVANSGAVVGLISLIGHIESDMPNLVALCEEFCLVRNPDEFVLNCLFENEDIKTGSTARQTIPLLVDLLRPMPDRPRAPAVAVHLLTQIAVVSNENKLAIAEAGALDALSKYMSLSPQDLTETTISELLKILFTNSELLRYEAAVSCANQLIAILHLGSRNARLTAVQALYELFDSESIRNSEESTQAVQPLVDMLGSASEIERHAALGSLIKLTSQNSKIVAFMADAEGNVLKSLHRILSSTSSSEVKANAAQLCFVLFSDQRFSSLPFAAEFLEPLLSLMQSGPSAAVETSVFAFEKLLDGEVLVDLTSAYDIVDLLVHLVSGSNYRLIEASICALIKLGKDRTPRKLHMVKAGIIDNCLQLLPTAPGSLCSRIAELFRILTNSSAISKSSSAIEIVQPLFTLLLRSDFCLWGQHSALQALVNILEKPQSLASVKLVPSQIIRLLVTFLESPSQAIQQLGSELLSHLLEQEQFKDDITTKSAVVPLVQLVGIGTLNLQQTAIKALESISLGWPDAVADAGGIFELAKVVIEDDPEPSDALFECAALVLTNILRSSADFYFKVPVVVLVKMLRSTQDITVTFALNALIVQERTDAASSELMVEAGVIDALLDLLRSHQCEESSGRLLEALFDRVRIREMKVSKYAIAPLAQYLLDPQTRSPSSKLLAALALGNLSQHEGLARASDSVSACRALVSLLEEQLTGELTMVGICALQNFVTHSRTNRRAVAEAGGILVIQELLLCSNSDIGTQAALLTRLLFSNHTLQEYVSNELIRSLTAALEKALWSGAKTNEEILRTIHTIFTNFPKVHVSEAVTLCIPQLIEVIKSDTDASIDSALNTMCLLKHSWSTMPIDVSRSQSMVAAEAIPVLQKLLKSCPPSVHEKADSLLHSLPGCLTVTVMRANNLKQAIGGTNAFCQLAIGHGPTRQTKVVSHSTSPEWKESFTWAFDVPPKGQKLHIACKSKSTFGKTTLGKVTIQIDKVVSEGAFSGLFKLSHESNKEGSSRTLEVEISWSNRIPGETV